MTIKKPLARETPKIKGPTLTNRGRSTRNVKGKRRARRLALPPGEILQPTKGKIVGFRMTILVGS